MSRLSSILAVACLVVPSQAAMAALLVQGYDDARHDRFYVGPDKAFVGDPYDWSAVGRLVGAETWATAISPSYFISATHYHPGVGATIRFFHGNDPNGTYEDRSVISGAAVGSTDLWIGKLNAPFSSQIALMPVLRLANDFDYIGQQMHIMGRASTSPTQTNMRMGRNVISSVVSNHIWWSYDTPGLGPDEAQTQSGDSGSGSFIIYAGRPALVGIHHYVNGDTFVPGYINEINALMGSERLILLTEADLPEPATLLLAGLGTLGLLIGRMAGRKRHTRQPECRT